ncbi:unnamed protein product [Amoebophrya sp. A120]|nr:unnamed protein product [Amoebophrya sp. A120]|eukprot:GSA120T00025473001.1
MLVWNNSELCIAWPQRAPLVCHAKTQFHASLNYGKTCHARGRMTVCSLFPFLHHKFPDIQRFLQFISTSRTQ